MEFIARVGIDFLNIAVSNIYCAKTCKFSPNLMKLIDGGLLGYEKLNFLFGKFLKVCTSRYWGKMLSGMASGRANTKIQGDRTPRSSPIITCLTKLLLQHQIHSKPVLYRELSWNANYVSSN